MSYLKRFGLVAAAIAFLMSVSVITGYAQRSYRDRSWQNRDSSWQYGQYRRYRRGGYRMSPWQYRRMMRARYYRRMNRYDGNYRYNNYRDRRRQAGRSYQYRRNVYLNQRNW